MMPNAKHDNPPDIDGGSPWPDAGYTSVYQNSENQGQGL